MSLRCSLAASEEPLPGSAPSARAWLALELPGAWTDRPLTSARFPEEFAVHAKAWEARGLRTVVIRRPGARRAAEPSARRIYLSDVVTGQLWTTDVAELSEVLTWPWDSWLTETGALARPGDLFSPAPDPLFLVCTNGARDQCCAVEGRSLAAAAAVEFPEQVWEVSHLSGHRFAPTGLQLPTGMLYGRLTLPAVAAALSAPPEAPSSDGARGRSALPPPQQVAELALVERVGAAGWSATWKAQPAPPGQGSWIVAVPDGVRLRIDVRPLPPGEHQGPARPESCGKPALEWARWHADVHEVTTG